MLLSRLGPGLGVDAVFSGSCDGCRGLQPLEFGHFPVTAERSNRIAQVL
jgi:hypothetical protein